jgi:hypothetical protein
MQKGRANLINGVCEVGRFWNQHTEPIDFLPLYLTIAFSNPMETVI